MHDGKNAFELFVRPSAHPGRTGPDWFRGLSVCVSCWRVSCCVSTYDVCCVLHETEHYIELLFVHKLILSFLVYGVLHDTEHYIELVFVHKLNLHANHMFLFTAFFQHGLDIA